MGAGTTDATNVIANLDVRRGLPPGQKVARTWKVSHYGPVPRRTDPASWDIHVFGATASGREHVLDFDDLDALPRISVRADMHCVSGYTTLDLHWSGIPAWALTELVPPRDDVRYVMAYAQFGYSANLRLSDFLAEGTLLATHVDGMPLPPEHGGPLRLVVPHLYAWKGPKWLRAIEYLTHDRRGFWEERGYHNIGDPWSGRRYSYQEETGEGPPLFDEPGV
ncbi:MAG TPA: molybdopterin-dependent oxidoreductase [Actinopolymorphaceae bacterium]|jgi:DMSO/TMAO reductase YedYZ molybdopterin-dependent catalytic subunit